MKIGQKRRIPNAPSTMLSVTALSNLIPTDDPQTRSWRESGKGNRCLRVAGTTRRREWIVDIYSSRFFYIKIGNLPGHTAGSIREAVTFLQNSLGVHPQPDPEITFDE
jgi:hypothetical protein